MNRRTDDRSPQAIAYHWASRITTVSIEMVAPGVLGVWADRKLGTRFVFTMLGFGLGLALGMNHLLKMTRPETKASGQADNEPPERHERS